MLQLEGRTALVTGAAQGNGAAIAEGLAAQGARVVLADLNLAAAEELAARISERGGTAIAEKLDVTDFDCALSLAQALAEKEWLVDLLVNNAGVCPRVAVDEPDFQRAWALTIDVNLNGMMNVTRAFLSHLESAKEEGTIVNVASIAAFVNTPSILAYPASKAGVRGLTRAMAGEFAAKGVRVNAIAPGQFNTPMLAASLADPKRRAQITSRILLKRVGEPEELVGPVVFLSSKQSSFVTGVTLPVDGGYLTS